MAHQHLGLAEIQSAVGLGELFDTLVVFENYPLDESGRAAAQAGGLRLAGVSGQDATHYPLGLMAIPGERLRLRFDYRPDLFERASVEALAGRFIRMLEGAVAAPDRTIGSVDLLSQEERATILRGWNTTAHALLPATLPALFAAQAARCPDAIAVVFEEERLCYGELDRRANQLAHHLRGLGVGPETVVGLCLARSLDLLVGLLGILKAGGAYLPLDPDYPRERLAFMLADAGARVLITHGATHAVIEEALDGALHGALLERQSIVPRRVRLDVDAAAIAEHPTSAPAVALDPHHPAYVIYTSGSTGTPKGVLMAHGPLANLILWSADA